MRFKIKELYNTKYLYITLNADLVYLFSTCEQLQKDKSYVYNVGNELLGKVYDAVKSGTTVEFDFAGTKISPDVVNTLNLYASKGFVFVDSKDSWRDEIFKTNRERLAIDTSGFIDLPKYDSSMMIKEYIESLDKTVSYKVPMVDADIYIPLTVLIMLTRPSIKILLDSKAKDLFTFVGERLTVSDLMQYKQFYFTTPEGTQVLDFSSGKAYVQRLGYSDIVTACTIGTLVPIEFGSIKLLSIDCWDNLMKECLGIINRYRGTRKVTLEELLT